MELEDLSAAWLTGALREAGVVSEARVRSFSASGCEPLLRDYHAALAVPG